jgi:hypothetical protein
VVCDSFTRLVHLSDMVTSLQNIMSVMVEAGMAATTWHAVEAVHQGLNSQKSPVAACVFEGRSHFL